MSLPIGQELHFGNDLFVNNINFINERYMINIQEFIEDNEQNIYDYESEDEDWDF